MPYPTAADLENCIQLYCDGKYAEALALLKKILATEPKSLTALNAAAACLKGLGDLETAREYWVRALEIDPSFADAHNNLGNLLLETGFLDDAEIAYQRALDIEPNYGEAHFNLANLHRKRDRFLEAEKTYRRVLEIQPDHTGAHSNLGALYIDQRRFAEAEQAYMAVLRYKPHDGLALCKINHIRRHNCDWQGLESTDDSIARLIDTGQSSALVPFELLAIPRLSPIQLKNASASFAAAAYCQPCSDSATTKQEAPKCDGRLRIGYLSADFHDHATAHLLCAVLENHDSSKFAVFIYSYGPDKKDNYRKRFVTACEAFRDMRHLSDHEAATQIVDDRIEILIDLKGYTSGARLGITALRPAPVIVNWLGFPGTLGHPRLADYIIGDSIVTPPEHASHFSETLALLPHCYQPNDRGRPIGRKPTHREAGLPEDAFVFCCFNQNYKITPDIFSIWCRLLQEFPDSILWILRPRDQSAVENLQREAIERGVPKDRIIFAPPLVQAEHLARLQIADLALDTYPITSHTTASDALWSGVPLITRIGKTFASRVAASVLNAANLPELITTSDAEYEALALQLARDKSLLKNIRLKLAVQRKSAPLFDTGLFARNLESLYRRIWAAHKQGKRSMIELKREDVAESGDSATPPLDEIRTEFRERFNGCPLCSNKDEYRIAQVNAKLSPFYKEPLPTDFNWVRCTKCGHVHTEYYWTDAGLKILLGTAHPHQVAGNFDVEILRRAWSPIVQRVIQLTNQAMPVLDRQLTWLDAGCGDGALVMTATEFGFNAIGLDVRTDAVNALKARGYRCHRGDLSTINVDQPVHVLSLMDLLEHLPDPIRILKRAYEMLRPDGLLLISCPNMSSMSWKEMDRNNANPYWIELEHCHNFTRESLISLLTQFGFTAIRYDVSERYKAGMDLICRRGTSL